MADLVQRYADHILGTLSCYDRVIVRGRLAGIDYARGMAVYLRDHGVLLFDFAEWANQYREEIRENAERLAQEHGLEIRFVRGDERKETLVAEILAQRGESPGLVAIFSALEMCESFEARYDKKKGHPLLHPRRAKVTHYYFYFIDEDLGLCFLRVSTWCPFAVQAYYNGHNVLAAKLRKAGIAFQTLDNAFASIADWGAAQKLADECETRMVHAKLDHYAHMFCPVIDELKLSYQWNLAQVEYSTDIVFRSQVDLAPVYNALVRTAVHTVTPDNIRTFLGRTRPLPPNIKQEVGTDFQKRVQGTCIKHRMGPTSIKMYDKAGSILRIETTTYNPSWFTHYRTVVHRNKTTSHELAPLKKSLYSLHDLRQLAVAANRRYLAFISSLDDSTVAFKAVAQLSEKVEDAGRSYRGFNFFSEQDLQLFGIILRGENTITGFRNADVRKHLPDKSPGQVSRMLKRLWMHDLIKKVGGTYKYYLSELGRTAITMGLKLKELVLIPELARALT